MRFDGSKGQRSMCTHYVTRFNPLITEIACILSVGTICFVAIAKRMGWREMSQHSHNMAWFALTTISLLASIQLGVEKPLF